MPSTEQQLTLPENWRAFLADVDEALEEHFTIRCLGGFVLAALYALPRPTADVDYVEITPLEDEHKLLAVAGPDSRLAKKHKLFIHRAQISAYPEEFESRMTELDLGLQKLHMFVLGPYDLVLNKLCTDRPKDFEDAKHLIKIKGLELEWEKLFSIWESEMKFMIPPRLHSAVELAKEYFEP